MVYMSDSVRFPASLLLSVVPATLLFWALWAMTTVPITLDPPVAVEVKFERQKADTDLIVKTTPRKILEPPPVIPEVPRVSINNPGGEIAQTRIIPPTLPAGPVVSGNTLAGIESDVMPMVRVNPDYPPRALDSGTEGWVQLQFTVTAIGTVTDAIVVKSSSKIFEAAALKAIARWRYNPKVVDGEGVERVGLQTLIRFELEN